MPREFNKITRVRNYFFTYNNYPSVQHVITRLRAIPVLKWYIMQEEIGEANGTPHLQGTFGLTNSVSGGAVIKYLADAHFSLSFPDDLDKCIDYCGKEATRKPGTMPYIHGPVPGLGGGRVGKPPAVSESEQRRLEATFVTKDRFYAWQSLLYDELQQEPDDRTIRWYWEPTGRIGKTQFCRTVIMEGDAIYFNGGYKDVMCSLALWIEKNGKYPRIAFLNIPRDKSRFVSWQVLEALKDGIGFSSKYESGQVAFCPMHVVVFANFAPDVEAAPISRDRWKIHRINGGGESLDTHVFPPVDHDADTQGYAPAAAPVSPVYDGGRLSNAEFDELVFNNLFGTPQDMFE